MQIVIIRQNILSQIFPSQQMSSHPSPNFGDLICLATILWIKICNRFVGYKVLKIRKLEHSGCSLFLLELYRYYHVIFCLFVPHNSIPTLALKQKLHLLWSFHSWFHPLTSCLHNFPANQRYVRFESMCQLNRYQE